jgi:proteasome lid subunit RPN8/RPN11
MLNITQKQLAEITKHAADDYPQECCGVLLGLRQADVRHVLQTVRCRNVHPSPSARYTIDPPELIIVQRDARDLQMEIIGFYHSHPEHPAQWSTTDLEQAHWEGCSYLIISVERRLTTAARSFVLDIANDRRTFIEEALIEAAVNP